MEILGVDYIPHAHESPSLYGLRGTGLPCEHARFNPAVTFGSAGVCSPHEEESLVIGLRGPVRRLYGRIYADICTHA